MSDIGSVAMRMGVILPTVKLYGGVRRFVELGSIFIKRGHSFAIFTPEGKRPEWCDFRGDVATHDELRNHAMDVLFITETDYLDLLVKADARIKAFYVVSESQAVRLKRVLRHPEISILVNSSGLFELVRRTHGITPAKAVGGVDAGLFRSGPQESAHDAVGILTYGRLSRRGKGTQLVVRACEHLYNKGYKIKLVLFDTPVNEQARQMIADFKCKLPYEFIVDHPVGENYKIFEKAEIFAGAERKAGWSNTCAEAMACGLAVVATKAGTRDFLEHEVTGLIVWRHWWFIARAIRRLIESPVLRTRLAAKGNERIRSFTWDAVADDIMRFVEGKQVVGPGQEFSV